MRQSRSGRLTFNGTEILVLYIQSYIYFYRNVVCHLNDFLLYSWPGLYIFQSCTIFLYPFRIRNIQKRNRSPPFRTPCLLPQNHPLQKKFRLLLANCPQAFCLTRSLLPTSCTLSRSSALSSTLRCLELIKKSEIP